MNKKNKLYDLILNLLKEFPAMRSSDKKLIWNVWGYLGYVHNGHIGRQSFMNAPTPETITRCRRKIQEHKPELRATVQVQNKRKEKEETKGNFIYQEELDI